MKQLRFKPGDKCRVSNIHSPQYDEIVTIIEYYRREMGISGELLDFDYTTHDAHFYDSDLEFVSGTREVSASVTVANDVSIQSHIWTIPDGMVIGVDSADPTITSYSSYAFKIGEKWHSVNTLDDALVALSAFSSHVEELQAEIESLKTEIQQRRDASTLTLRGEPQQPDPLISTIKFIVRSADDSLPVCRGEDDLAMLEECVTRGWATANEETGDVYYLPTEAGRIVAGRATK